MPDPHQHAAWKNLRIAGLAVSGDLAAEFRILQRSHGTNFETKLRSPLAVDDPVWTPEQTPGSL